MHCVRDIINEGLAQIVKVKFEDNTVDMLTKAVNSLKLMRCRFLVNISSVDSTIEGRELCVRMAKMCFCWCIFVCVFVWFVWLCWQMEICELCHCNLDQPFGRNCSNWNGDRRKKNGCCIIAAVLNCCWKNRGQMLLCCCLFAKVSKVRIAILLVVWIKCAKACLHF